MTNSINRRAVLSNLSRRVGPVFADMAADFDYPAGWGMLFCFALIAASYKPAHGGYPGTPVMNNQQQVC